MDHISVVMNTITWEKNVQDQVLKGALSRLLGEYLALPACAREKTEVALGDYVLSHLMEAVRSHTSAVINCLGDKAVDRMVEGSGRVLKEFLLKIINFLFYIYHHARLSDQMYLLHISLL